MNKMEWSKSASNLLKAELKRRGVNYEGLQEKLAAIGVDETTNSTSVKVNRGTFSFIFFMQAMKALDAKTVRLDQE